MSQPLKGKIALVAGGTRGAGRGIAIELGRAGATVYVTGRTTRHASSPMNRPETIEETAELVAAAGGVGIAIRCDHSIPSDVQSTMNRIREDGNGRLDILVNDTWGGDSLIEWKPLWEHDLKNGLQALRVGLETHLITLHTALPLLIESPGGLVVEITDGDDMFNARYRGSMFFDIVKVALARVGRSLQDEVAQFGATSVSLTPGYLRSEAMLEGRGVAEEDWRDVIASDKSFAISESPFYMGRAVVALAADPDRARFGGRSLSSGQLAREYGFTDVDGSRPNASGYFAAAVFGDDPDADVTNYR